MKILVAPNKECFSHYNGPIMGGTDLYPENTIRIVRKWFLFPRKLKGISMRGSCTIIQESYHAFHATNDDSFTTAEWKNVKFIENKEIGEIKLKRC